MMRMHKGSYLLFMTFRNSMTSDIGSLGKSEIGPGEYCYVGSAMNGFAGRINRHMAAEKKVRWHIDRLTLIADGMEAYVSPNAEECMLAHSAEKCGGVQAIKGFGCSDCRCRTHLFLMDTESKRKLLDSSGAALFRVKDM